MGSSWRNALWSQFGAAIDTLEAALVACPDALWTQTLWRVSEDDSLPAALSAFWYLAFHALFWLDLYLSGTADGFAPPAPFNLDELDPAGVVSERPYTRDELRTYLAYTRQKCQTILGALTDEQAQRLIAFPWTRSQPVTFVELQLYNMRHVQEHAAQLLLLLGQHDIHDAPSWVARAKAAPGGA